MRSFSAWAQFNTDDNALIEFAAPRDLLRYQAYDRYSSSRRCRLLRIRRLIPPVSPPLHQPP